MNGKLRLGILFGGRSGEHDVSLMSARSVLSVLDPNKYEIIPIGITQQGVWVCGTNSEGAGLLDALWERKTGGLTRVTLLPELGQSTLYAVHEKDGGERLEALANLDVIFPVLHGTFGEDGTVQGLFELADLAYVGANVLGSAVGMDKAMFKDVMRANVIPVVESICITRGEIEADIQGVIARAEGLAAYPLFTKPANLGSSVGITKCRNRSDLYEGLMEAAAYDRRVLVERGIVNAREIEVSVLGNDHPQASVPGEVRPSGDFYTYEAKYQDERSELVIPAPIPEETAGRIRELAVRAFQAIDGSGMARADFLLDPRTQEVFLGEINTIPGFTKISMYPKLWEASGLPYAGLIDRLVELAVERKADRDRTERRFRRGR
ncbi:MAG: D-alanine--D-alanine ligase [Chloroflexi bacterium]|nr:MAG: D-alanine--D-alanine ligase [Chloroflexota bacterium]